MEALKGLPISVGVGKGHSQVGGGTLPQVKLPTVTVDLVPKKLALEGFAARMREGDPEAEVLLRNLVEADAPIPEAYDLLASIYANRGLSDAVAAVYTRGVRNQKLPPQVRNRFGMLLKARPQR